MAVNPYSTKAVTKKKVVSLEEAIEAAAAAERAAEVAQDEKPVVEDYMNKPLSGIIGKGW